MRKGALFILAAVASTQPQRAASAAHCGTFDSNMGATFDFSDLSRSGDQPAYTVEDGDLPCTTTVEQNYSYYFNVCGSVSGNLPANCASTLGASAAGALQVDMRGTASATDDWCFVVGTYSETQMATKLLDHSDPTKGVALTYGGTNCHNGDQRKFNIELMCADKMTAVPTHALEFSHCSYTITMPSIYGCPLECPVSNRHLCGGQGHCAYDEDKGGARCFCNNGYTGSDCATTATSTSEKNYSPALLGLIITLFIIIVALIGSLLFMVKQMSAYKEDLANYQVLKGAPDEEGSAVV